MCLKLFLQYFIRQELYAGFLKQVTELAKANSCHQKIACKVSALFLKSPSQNDCKYRKNTLFLHDLLASHDFSRKIKPTPQSPKQAHFLFLAILL